MLPLDLILIVDLQFLINDRYRYLATLAMVLVI